MTLEDYMKIRFGANSKTKALSYTEAKILDIDYKKAGWYKRHQFDEIADHTLYKVLQSSINNEVIGSSVKARLVKAFGEYCPTKLEDGNKFIYLMRNSEGLYKIGISKNPIKRRQSLMNTSGFKITICNYWKVSKDAGCLEKEMHNHFASFRRKGEWFDQCISDITMENHFDCVYTRML